MDRFECSICNHGFDDTTHRPRALPCGHGFCTQCIDESISRGNKSCLICREEHGANSSADIPVSFLLEEFVHKAKTASASASQKSKSDSSFDIEIAGICEKHTGIPLYFHCKSHDTKVCHSCVVIDHPPMSCNLISLEGEIKEKKQLQILKVDDRKQDLMDTEKDFEILYKRGTDYIAEKNNKKQELENEVQLLRKKIEQINKEIGNKGNFQSKIKNAIQECQKKQQCFEVMKNKLKNTMSNQDIVKELKATETEIQQIQKWEDNLRRALNMMKVSEESNKFAQVTRNNIQHCSKIFSEIGRTFVPSLTKDLMPPSNALIIEESELDLSSDTTTVFMDLSGNGHYLGRIFIRIFGSTPHGQAFIMLALGTFGESLKKTCLHELSGRSFDFKKYFGRGTSFNTSILKQLKEKEHPGKKVKGRLFMDHSSCFGDYTLSFVICLDDFKFAPKKWGYIGDVISGMDILKSSVNEYAKEQVATSDLDLSDITISECGIVLNY